MLARPCDAHARIEVVRERRRAGDDRVEPAQDGASDEQRGGDDGAGCARRDDEHALVVRRLEHDHSRDHDGGERHDRRE
jgi:hypothetical protein